MHVAAAEPVLLAFGSPALQTVAGMSRGLLLGLLAVLVLPVITILFVGHLVDRQTIDEERVRRIETELGELREEVGHTEDGRSGD